MSSHNRNDGWIGAFLKALQVLLLLQFLVNISMFDLADLHQRCMLFNLLCSHSGRIQLKTRENNSNPRVPHMTSTRFVVNVLAMLHPGPTYGFPEVQASQQQTTCTHEVSRSSGTMPEILQRAPAKCVSMCPDTGRLKVCDSRSTVF